MTDMADEDMDDALEWEGPSKSELKRQMHALQEIGERLVALPNSQLAKMPIEDDSLRESIDLARRIKARSGRRRQLQYIGKLMRGIDPTPIIEALAALDGQHQADNARFHQLETLRDRLLSEGDKAIGAAAEVYPALDRGHVRQLLRNHQKDMAAGRPSGAGKALFRYLRDLDEAQENAESS